jgi:uncharacterized protein YjfI (DUF2170 family)
LPVFVFFVFIGLPSVAIVVSSDKLVPLFAVGLVSVWVESLFVVEKAVTAGSAFWDIFGEGRSVVVG